MADKSQDPLVESLMQLAVSAAPLIRRAREAGMFKTGSAPHSASETVVDVAPEPPPPPPPPPPAADFGAEKQALQDIIVSQAMKIAALEAEIARLKAVPPQP